MVYIYIYITFILMLITISKYNKRWLSFAMAISGNKHEAEDILQDTYLKLHKLQPPKLITLLNDPVKNEKQINSYIFFCLKHVFIDRKRKQAKTIRVELTDIAEPEQTQIEDGQQLIINQFDKLPWLDQQLILESIDKSYRKLAEELNASQSFIFKRVAAAKQKLIRAQQ